MVVLDIGRLHEHGQQRTFRIGDDMTLATLDPLRHVKSTRAATFRGFHSLAVDDAGGGTKLAPLPLAHLGNQGVIDQTPQSRSTPLVEVISNGRTRRKILWQRAPLTSRARDVEDRIYDDTQIGLAWPATSARCRHKRFNQFPLLIRRIACITQFVAPILFTGDFSPRHVVCSLVLSQARRNHNGLESLNFLFRSDFQETPNGRANVGSRRQGRPGGQLEADTPEHETAGGGASLDAVDARIRHPSGAEDHRRRDRAGAQPRRRLSCGPAELDRSLRVSWCSGRSALGLTTGLAAFRTRNLIGPGAVDLLRSEFKFEAFAHYAGKKTPYRVLLQAGGFHHRGDRCARGRLQHGDDARLLRRRIAFLRPGGTRYSRYRRLCSRHLSAC